jgi:hypothetical protein
MLNKFNEKQKEVEILEMNKKAEDVVTRAVAIGAIPIPILFANQSLFISSQVAMVAKISEVQDL